MNTASNPFDDMSNDLDFGAPAKAATVEVAYFEQACPKCNGTGRYTFGYINVRSGECFACKGKGKMTFKTSPATRLKAKMATQKRAVAKVEAQANKAQEWKEANPAEAAWMEASAGNFEFARSMLDALNKYGHLTEKQMETVQRLTVQSAERQAARAVEQAARAVSAPVVTVQAIEVAFNNAKEAGVKYPKLRLDTFVFSPAGENSKNAGAIYVKSKGDGVYLGKLSKNLLTMVFMVSKCDITIRFLFGCEWVIGGFRPRDFRSVGCGHCGDRQSLTSTSSSKSQCCHGGRTPDPLLL